MPAHLYLTAVRMLETAGEIAPAEGRSAFESLMWDVRLAYFRDLVDISQRENLDALAQDRGFDTRRIATLIDSGAAYAELFHDLELQRKHNVPVSPSLVFNEGRQLLNGNVGYRVIEANLRELLHRDDLPFGSWC